MFDGLILVAAVYAFGACGEVVVEFSCLVPKRSSSKGLVEFRVFEVRVGVG